MKPLKAIIWKEVRENLALPVLAWVLFGVSFAWSLNPVYAGSGTWQNFWPEVFTPPFWWLSPLLAVALAISQSVRELGRDQWAFLVHRPISRGNIFVGKVLAGLGMYLGACFLSLLVAVLWFSRPGVLVGPVVPGLLWPAVVGVLVGTPFYFAVTLVILRPALWYGSRALPVVAAFVCTGIVLAADYVFNALVAQLIFSLFLGITAWGTFIRREELKQQPRAAQIPLGVVLGFGLTVVGLTVLTIGATKLDEMWRKGTATRSHTGAGGWLINTLNWRALEFLSSDNTFFESDQITFKQLDDSNRYYATLDFGLPRFGDVYNYARPENITAPFFRSNYFEPEQWFFVPSQGVIRGFDTITKLEVGSIGVSGFAAVGQPKPQPFPGHWIRHGTLEGFGILMLTRGIYAVDLKTHKVRELARAEGDDEIREASLRPITKTGQEFGLGAVLRSQELDVYDATGKVRATLPMPADLDGFQWATLNIASRRPYYYEVELWRRRTRKTADSHRALYFDRAGRLVSKNSDNLWAKEVPDGPEAPTVGAFIGAAAPPSVVVGMGVTLLARNTTAPVSDTLWQTEWDYNQPFLLCMLAVSALSLFVCAYITHRIAGRCGFDTRTRRKWAIAGAVLGPLGILLMLSLLAWPSMVPCHKCRRKRLTTKDSCEHCGAGWPKRVTDGTEILFEVEEPHVPHIVKESS